MPENLAKIGIIGLAVMGSNFARNLSNKGIKTAVYNRTSEVTDEFITKYGNEQLISTKSLKEFKNKLEKPRKIVLLVKAGPAVDAVINSLTLLLEKDDIIIDFGNTHYSDTERRTEELNKKSIHFWGCGISGGEKGALHGPSLMPGGPKESWPILKPIFEKAAAKDFSGKPCVTYIGPGSAGNYIKMVHNGIEYGIMQIMAEAYELMKTLLDMPAPLIAQVFKKFDQGKLNGFLFELAETVLKYKEQNNYLINKIQDKAAQKGTGSWTATESLQISIPAPTITEAVISRIISSKKEEREKLYNIYKHKVELENLNTDQFIAMLDDALYTGIICTFAQGFELIQKKSEEKGWNIDLAGIARIWQGGCIIRTILLKTIEDEFQKYGNKNLLEMPKITSLIQGNIENLKKVVLTALKNKIPVSGLSSTLNYFYAMTQKRGNANFIQALRDGFGAHTYERVDKKGTFHTEWL
jgi:6-phosphogluconate dehydrogenase